ncbi:hypothetical protein T12_1197 [Trichinella patagoniensis]|uniref:Uncharacterized protein n=1 Tax=Trichinella patagoniensis TaxID=990121 RepID=A0A0V1AG59_9BILA|nr:hypothetical protein T12_1197 [Trichinella patagoniensis]
MIGNFPSVELRCPFGEPLMRQQLPYVQNRYKYVAHLRGVGSNIPHQYDKKHTSMVFVCLNAVSKPRHRCPTGKALPLQPVPVCNSTTYPLSTHFCHLKATVISAFTACCPRSCMNNTNYTSTLCASRPTDAINL